MVCLRNISVDTLHKGDTEDDNNNNHNNNNNNNIIVIISPSDSVTRRDSILFKDKLKLLVAFQLTLQYTDNFGS
jgi:hypothetical protein